MKIKNNVKHFNVIYVLVVFLLFALMPITISSTAEGEYQISDEQTLKNWLQDSGSVQTNNPNAILTTDITLNWGGVAPDGVGQGSSAVNSGSTLDGQGHNVIIQGGSNVIGDNGRSGGLDLKHDSSPYYVGMFVQYIYGTIKGINFSFASDKTLTIDYYKNKGNEQIFTGIIAGSIENGRVEGCNITIDKNITYNERNAYNDVNGAEISGSGSNHSGGVAGRIVGSTVIKNVRIVQNAGTTITIHTNHGTSNFDRWAFIASDSYRDGSGNVPQIINVQIERYGNLVIRDDSSTSKGNYLYGIVIADMSTDSNNDANHAVHINGVIYNGVADVAWGANDQIDFGNYGGPDGFSYNYFTGRYPNGSTIHNEPDRFQIQNIYSYVQLTNEGALNNEVGVSLISTSYTASFDPNQEGKVIFTKTDGNDNTFIYSIQPQSSSAINTYLNLSNTVAVDKFNVARENGMDSITILDGSKVDNASFGFQYEEVTYNGLAHTAIFEVNDQIITEGFTVKYENNVHSTVTNNGALATCTFEHPDTPEGIFLHSTRQYVANEAIDLTYYQEMTILQAPLSLTYTGSNIYDNNLAISGLVNNEQLIINGTKYSNGNFNFDCTNNVTNKVISFTDGIIKTNYNISYSGISEDTFVVNPKVIAVDEGITITNAQDQTIANFADNVLTIYSKSYNTIELTFAQEEGYLNRAIFNTNNDTTYNILSSLEGTTMSYVVSPQNENDFAFIEDLTLDVSLTRVALRFEINDKSLISSLKVNGEDVYKFGQYFAFDCDYNEMATITVTAAEGDYTIEFLVNDMPASSSDGTLTVNAKGDANNMMYIKINITAA